MSTPFPLCIQDPFHFVMGAVRFEHDFPLDFGILEGGVAFDEVKVASDEAVNDFGGHAGAGGCVLGHEAVFLAKLAVGGAVGESFRHLHGVPNLEGIKHFAPLAVKPFKSRVQCVNVEAGIVGDNRNAIFTAGGGDDVHQHITEAGDFPLALGDVGIVAGELLGVVRGLHPLGFTEEDFPHNVGFFADDGAGSRFNHGKADVIGQIVAGHNLVEFLNVAGFGIQYKQTIFHGVAPLSIFCVPSWNTIIISHIGAGVKRFFGKFQKKFSAWLLDLKTTGIPKKLKCRSLAAASERLSRLAEP